ncbi:hypothetical protein RG963_11685 [Methanosarcina sp. Z-7115]|uniref:Uncharacterized protein n=1 Tax=Methanosarcina baikalica TaxID=3073890 RepID=A0ABU2D365_9EURY|nr:hypothetical protein [Methanosarcina sp. Z-7115]MDR7666430.1 hypothetical protein [Methanosarcina sp. Z-7115]
MKIGWKWAGTVLTFSATLMIEVYIGVPLDEFYWLDLVLQAVNNSFMLSMPNTGPFAQATKNTVLLVNFVHVLLILIPAILLAGAVYHLIPDEY